MVSRAKENREIIERLENNTKEFLLSGKVKYSENNIVAKPACGQSPVSTAMPGLLCGVNNLMICQLTCTPVSCISLSSYSDSLSVGVANACSKF